MDDEEKNGNLREGWKPKNKMESQEQNGCQWKPEKKDGNPRENGRAGAEWRAGWKPKR